MSRELMSQVRLISQTSTFLVNFLKKSFQTPDEVQNVARYHECGKTQIYENVREAACINASMNPNPASRTFRQLRMELCRALSSKFLTEVVILEYQSFTSQIIEESS
ncbi:hypothetical protein BofuT4_P139870.1 [Botrytis cinerea T4]|uniref:Uncharacterized protein n=1 Tax=Botryotinia fuckeliana (strain T4) TaxID=999810 RepID=G2YN65_BOTF4|nr:hypothetical protein BofuT4_P139870.1 [Botrytis cinerea T4]